jgi:restriction system protein
MASETKIAQERVGILMKTAMQAIHENGGALPSREVMNEVQRRLELSEYERGVLEKTNQVRWQSQIHFYSIDLQKAGWLSKRNGVWYITPEGVENLKYGPLDFITRASQAYKTWKTQAKKEVAKAGIQVEEVTSPEETQERVQLADYEQAQDLARKRISEYINDLDPYVFQDLVAALLRGMGYHTSFIAPKGKDGGIDVIAYRDPLGALPPRVKVQVKHRNAKATSQEVQQLVGVLNEEDIGLFVSTSGFTPDGVTAIRNSKKHIEKIDIDRFIDLRIEFYDTLDKGDRSRLPLRLIPYLAPEE